MDIMSYTERRWGLILTLFWSSCVQSSWYVILGNRADGTYYTQWLLSNKHIFPLNMEELHLFCEHGPCFNGAFIASQLWGNYISGLTLTLGLTLEIFQKLKQAHDAEHHLLWLLLHLQHGQNRYCLPRSL